MIGAGRHVIVGLGNRFRGDDGVGLELAERMRDGVPPGVEVVAIAGDPIPLIDILADAALALVADAVDTAAAPGTILRFDASETAVPGAVFGSSTHAFGLAETIELARALGKLHARVLVYGIAGADFSSHEGLSPAVAAALDTATEQLTADLALAVRRPEPEEELDHA